MRVFLSGILLGGILMPVTGAPGAHTTFERYQSELNVVIQREKATREAIAQEQAAMENLKQRIAETGARIDAVIRELYDILGITVQDIVAAESELGEIKTALERYLLRSSGELAGGSSEVERLAARFSALKAKRVCLLGRVAARVNEVERLLLQVKEQLSSVLSRPVATPFISSSRYTVGRNGTARNLSHIAAEVYGDQYQWPRIYRANRRFIDKRYAGYKTGIGNPRIVRPQDFVLPGWTLVIPR